MRIQKILRSLWFSFLILTAIPLRSQTNSNVFVNDTGVMLWGNDSTEVKGFGVNYSAPFAHAYRSAKRIGIDIKKAIDQDVYHFSRLGFDLYRIHVWDTEISDTQGNLLSNEHLDTFDYLLSKLTEYGINYVITPIAYWGNGWPEPDTDTPGFSHLYGKGDCLTNKDCIAAQKKYLYQFLNHVNPYKSVAYKNDPNLIAFEVSNEPHHRGKAAKVTQFVQELVSTMRQTGTKKPIFYNLSHGVHFADAYFDGGIQGGTFQWYPTGLGYQREIPGNVLPNVNDYDIPFDETIKKRKGAKIVYEFDAADIGKSYVYPAMARSFREAGIQTATHFAYDPTFLAPYNTEYNTHYMNLSYAPKKALALKICSEVFHEIPMYSNFGTYPENKKFGDFFVDYLQDLAVYNSGVTFIHTNSTDIEPKNKSQLKNIAGFGNSKLVQYSGTGAYFLDKIEDGLWRLEVMPDAIWVQNLFGRNSPKKTVAVVKWESQKMHINLDNLGDDFAIQAINQGNTFAPIVAKNEFEIRPGTYVLSKKGKAKDWSPSDSFGKASLGSFYGPAQNIDQDWFSHAPLKEISSEKGFTLEAQFVSEKKPQKIEVVIPGFGGKRYLMDTRNSYHYQVGIPAGDLKKGYFDYYVIVTKDNGKSITYPSGLEGLPNEWDFYDQNTYRSPVVPPDYPIHLFNASEDARQLVRQWRNGFQLIPTQESNEAVYEMNIEKLFVVDNENLNAEPIYDYSFKHFILDRIKGRKNDLETKENLVLKGYSLNEKPCKIQIAFVMEDGSSFGSILVLNPELGEYILPLTSLKPVKTVTLPRPYPSFLPYYFEHGNTLDFDIRKVESIQFSIGPGLSETEIMDKHGLGLVSIRLE